jgi:hypothetical protein
MNKNTLNIYSKPIFTKNLNMPLNLAEYLLRKSIYLDIIKLHGDLDYI